MLSPFRLGEQPNIRVGVAMITSAREALALHEKMARELWARALKGAAAGAAAAVADREAGRWVNGVFRVPRPREWNAGTDV